MRVEILASAAEHIADGYWFYENQLPGLGAHFRASILADIRSLSINAGVHELHFEKYFRAVSKRFPFAIFYLVEEQVARVYAVVDCRRNPEWVKRQLM